MEGSVHFQYSDILIKFELEPPKGFEGCKQVEECRLERGGTATRGMTFTHACPWTIAGKRSSETKQGSTVSRRGWTEGWGGAPGTGK